LNIRGLGTTPLGIKNKTPEENYKPGENILKGLFFMGNIKFQGE